MAQLKKVKKSKQFIKSMRVGPQGRVVIPADLRKEMGVTQGDTLVGWIEGDKLILESREKAEEDLWAQFRQLEGSLAQELIHDRRKEAKRENQD